MTRSSERLRVAAISLCAVLLFFIEYIPPFKQVRFWSDIEGYHHPLLTYTHNSLREGRLPQWDPAIYCGIPFAGNLQASLFYPPNWLLYVVHWRHDGLPLVSIEILAILHVWLAFFLGFLWFRGRTKHWLPAVLGAGVIAFGGYMLSQMNHLGVGFAFAWMPLGFWGIDEASRSGDWSRLWKLAVASALCFIAGYPPTWIAFAVFSIVYALVQPGHVKVALQALLALVFSFALSAASLLPAAEAARLKIPEQSFGGGIIEAPGIWLSFLLPNYYDQNRTIRGFQVSDGPYFYLGVPALFALLWLLRRPMMRGAAGGIAIAIAAFWVMINPRDWLTLFIPKIPLAGDVVRQFNFMFGLSLAGAILAAAALDDFSSRSATWKMPRLLRPAWMACMTVWSAWLIFVWPRSGVDAPAGIASVSYALVLLVLFAAGLLIYRAAPSALVAALLIAGVFIDYKAFGTNRRFNAQTGSADKILAGDARFGGSSFLGLRDEVYAKIRADHGYRSVLVDGPHSTDLRYYGLSTPQGFDPFLPQQFKQAIEEFVPFTTNRTFDVDPANTKFLEHFGVKYIIITSGNPKVGALTATGLYKAVQPADSYYTVLEYVNAKPLWSFEGSARLTASAPERRVFEVETPKQATFGFIEQYFPGWRATIDQRDVPIDHWETAFQSVTVPAGKHRIEFRYAPVSLRVGVLISLTSLAGMVVALRRRRRDSGPGRPHPYRDRSLPTAPQPL